MDKKWTKEQEKILNSQGAILVSASAGTGKTAILTEKVVRTILEDGVDLTNILIVTFSNAAAEEMKDRIKSRIEKLYEETNDVIIKKRCLQQLNQFSMAKIQTIHSFCFGIIKEHFYKLNLDANVQIVEDLQLSTFKNKALDIVLKKYYENSNEDFLSLVEYFNDMDDFVDNILYSFNKISNIVDRNDWVNKSLKNYENDLDNIPLFMKNDLLKDFESALSYIQVCKEEMKRIENNLLSNSAQQIILEESILLRVINLLKNNDINAICECTFEDFGSILRFKKGYEKVKENRDFAKEIVSKYKKSLFSIKEELIKINQMYSIVKLFIEIIFEFENVFLDIKKKNNVIDFNDMEQFAYQILQDQTISLEYKNLFSRVFVDEYQDTSPIQESIIRNISNDQNVFCVGDLKQSIYRFRSSDPILFSNRGIEYKKGNGTVLSLSKNFRSSKNVLNCANDVFSCITKNSNEITYSQNDMLVHGRNDVNDKKINPVQVVSIPNDIGVEFDLSNDEIEVYNIINIIKDNLGKLIYDDKIKQYRPITYNDFVILCRKINSISFVVGNIFKQHNIPYYIDKSGNLLSSLEISLFISLLKTIKDLSNELDLIAIIHMGLFQFTDDDLLDLKLYDKNQSISENLLNKSNENDILGKRCKDFINFIKEIKNLVYKKPLTDLISDILYKTNFIDYIAIMDNGKQRVDNIYLFLQIVAKYEKNNLYGFYSFINYLNEISDIEFDFEEAKFSEVNNAVRITTIHRSKGLEYPIVIMPFMSKQFSVLDKQANVLIDKDCGIAFDYFDAKNNIKLKNSLRLHIENNIQEKNKEEEMRLLYVAMTRAKELLYMQGIVKNNEKLESLFEIKNMFDWILFTIYRIDSSMILNGSWEIKNITNEDFFDLLNNVDLKSEKKIIDEIDLEVINQNDKKKCIVENKFIPKRISASKLETIPYLNTSFIKPTCIIKNNSTTIGTLTHKFLRYVKIDKNKSMDFSYFLNELQRMVDLNIISDEDSLCLDINIILDFFNSEIGKKLIQSNNILREKNIQYLEKINGLDVLVKGTIDLLFESDGVWYLIDYKTDNIKKGNNILLNSRVEHHKKQLNIYKKAIENNLKINITKTLLVFLSCSTIVPV